MSETIYRVILTVDLHCSDCDKKIKRTLCKLQDREKIQSIVYDEKNNTVTITGPFDPKKLLNKICCKACKVIQEIQIVEEKPKPPPTPKLDVKLPDLNVKLPELVVKLPQKLPELVVKLPEKLPELVVKLPEPVVKPYPCPVPYPYPYPYRYPVWPPGSGGCCSGPRSEACYGGCRCGSCGWIKCPSPPPKCPSPPPAPPPTYVCGSGVQGCDGRTTCGFICEEQPEPCRMM